MWHKDLHNVKTKNKIKNINQRFKKMQKMDKSDIMFFLNEHTKTCVNKIIVCAMNNKLM
jgi:hypothetical protein